MFSDKKIQSVSHKTSVKGYLKPNLYKRFKKESGDTGKSESKIISEALEIYLKNPNLKCLISKSNF